MGKNVVIIGAQWGDEGKGKIVDLLSDKVAAVVRYQGGNNAGHTVVVGDEVLKLHLIPSGIMHEGVLSVIGSGVVFNPEIFCQEIDELNKKGIPAMERIRISHATPLILPSHIALDKAKEAMLGKKAIGTTGRGIGPAYEDKIARRTVRVGDLLNPVRFKQRLAKLLEYHNFVLENYCKVDSLDLEEMYEHIMKFAKRFKDNIVDECSLLDKLRREGKSILFEGAQGTMLDIDHGTYPYVTSSNTTSGAVSTGSGFGPTHLDQVIGIVKAYTTRVGAGPHITELTDATGDHLVEQGHEFGTTTGRRRRCGWLDLAVMRRSIQLNGLTHLTITKLDVLDGLKELKICTHYEVNGKRVDVPPFDAEDYAECKPVYISMSGWEGSIAGVTEYDKLPKEAKEYLAKIEEICEVPINMIATGPDRDETIIVESPFGEK